MLISYLNHTFEFAVQRIYFPLYFAVKFFIGFMYIYIYIWIIASVTISFKPSDSVWTLAIPMPTVEIPFDIFSDIWGTKY